MWTRFSREPRKPERWRPGMESGARERTFGLGSDFLPLHWEVHGREGPPLLLIHGLGTNGSTWTQWITRLSRNHRVFVVEMKGFGASPKPRDDRYAPPDQASLLHHLIVREDLRTLTLIGHSLGGAVALLVAKRLLKDDPPRLKRIVLVAGAAADQEVSVFLRLAGRPLLGKALLSTVPIRFLVREAMKRAYHDPNLVKGSLVESYAESLRSRGGRHAFSASARHLTAPDAREALAGIEDLPIPTLLLWGELDRIVPLQCGRHLQAVLPNATLDVLPGCGHMPQEERPQESLDRVLRFLATTD